MSYDDQQCGSSNNELDLRLGRVERALSIQRRITAALAALALVGCLAAFQSAQPEVVRARRFEVVDAQGRTVGAFGIGASLVSNPDGSEPLGWYLRDPQSEALASAFLGKCRVLTDKSDGLVPVATLALQSGNGYLQASAGDPVTSIEVFQGEDPSRSASLSVQPDRTALTFQSPTAGSENEKPQVVLKLQHASGKPTIQGWDEQGNVAIDIK